MSNDSHTNSGNVNTKPAITLSGTAPKIIDHGEPEKAQITINEAEVLYREIRIPNVLEDSDGQEVTLKEGTE